MPPAVLYLKNRFATADRRFAVGLFAALQLAALALLIWLEEEPPAQAAFVLAWGALNFFWLALLRRPLTAAALSLALIVVLSLLSQLKHSVVMMTATFVDVMIVDLSTLSFLLTIIPGLAWKVGLAVALAVPLLILLWRSDPFRVRRGTALAACVFCLGALAVLSFAVPTDREDEFAPHQYVSKFARSAAVAAVDLATRGVFEADPGLPDRASLAAGQACQTSRKLPHIVMVFDESSFDATMMPGVKVGEDYHARFRSSDGKMRSFVVEGAGGPSWFTEYNVLTGLSVRSYGRFATSVTRIAAGRVGRGLVHSLRRCDYKTFSLYPFYGNFLSSRAFQTTAGVEHYLDMRDLGTRNFEADAFYFDHAVKIIARERGSGPLFLYVYTVANHFPWDTRLRPELTPAWRDLGNAANIDEYIRRQGMTAQDYGALLEQLKLQFPGDSFLIVRYGDHLPEFGLHVVDPSAGEAVLAQRLEAMDPRYFTTYYAIDAVNFTPKDLSSALNTL